MREFENSDTTTIVIEINKILKMMENDFSNTMEAQNGDKTTAVKATQQEQKELSDETQKIDIGSLIPESEYKGLFEMIRQKGLVEKYKPVKNNNLQYYKKIPLFLLDEEDRDLIWFYCLFKYYQEKEEEENKKYLEVVLKNTIKNRFEFLDGKYCHFYFSIDEESNWNLYFS